MAFSALSTSCWPESFQYFFFPEEWEVSIYGRMIQHWCNILTGNMVQVSDGFFELWLWLFPNCNPAEVGLRLGLGARVLTWFDELNRGHLWRSLNSNPDITLQAVLQWQQHKIYLHRHQATLDMKNKIISSRSSPLHSFRSLTHVSKAQHTETCGSGYASPHRQESVNFWG